MLNVFVHTLKLHRVSGNVHGDQTNEPGCLKQHLEELFDLFPCLKLLTGDTIYVQRSLLSVGVESHFYIRSLDPDTTSPEKFQQLILQHGEIENCLHGQKDRFYGEDRHEKTLKEIRERSAIKTMKPPKKSDL